MGTRARTKMLTLVAGVVLALSILCFRARIDRWAHSRFMVSPTEDGLSHGLRFQRLEEKNVACRAGLAKISFYGSVLVVAFTRGRGQTIGDMTVFNLFVLTPLAAATNTQKMHAKYGWLNQLLQMVHYVYAIGLSNDVIASERSICTPLLMFAFNEFSLRSPSMLLFNHILLNIGMLRITGGVLSVPGTTGTSALRLIWQFVVTQDVSAVDTQACKYLWCPIVSILMVALFCYRRSRPIEESPLKLSVHNQEPEDPSKAQCARLLRLVLESGDEMCLENTQMIASVLSILTSNGAMHSNGPGSIATMGFGRGTGTGTDLLDEPFDSSWMFNGNQVTWNQTVGPPAHNVMEARPS